MTWSKPSARVSSRETSRNSACGTNDIVGTWVDESKSPTETIERAVENVRQIAHHIDEVCVGATVAVLSIPPLDINPAVQTRVDALNERMRDLCVGSRLLVDINHNGPTVTEIFDGIHFTTTGYKAIADRVYETLEPIFATLDPTLLKTELLASTTIPIVVAASAEAQQTPAPKPCPAAASPEAEAEEACAPKQEAKAAEPAPTARTETTMPKEEVQHEEAPGKGALHTAGEEKTEEAPAASEVPGAQEPADVKETKEIPAAAGRTEGAPAAEVPEASNNAARWAHVPCDAATCAGSFSAVLDTSNKEKPAAQPCPAAASAAAEDTEAGARKEEVEHEDAPSEAAEHDAVEDNMEEAPASEQSKADEPADAKQTPATAEKTGGALAAQAPEAHDAVRWAQARAAREISRIKAEHQAQAASSSGSEGKDNAGLAIKMELVLDAVLKAEGETRAQLEESRGAWKMLQAQLEAQAKAAEEAAKEQTFAAQKMEQQLLAQTRVAEELKEALKNMETQLGAQAKAAEEAAKEQTFAVQKMEQQLWAQTRVVEDLKEALKNMETQVQASQS